MIVEGKGRVAPSPVKVLITRTDVAVLSYEAERRNAHRSYASQFSTWKRGLTANPVLVGMVGELAIERKLKDLGVNCSVIDFSLNNGDGGKDAEIAGVAYQIKTSTKTYSTCLVRRVSETGKLLPLVADRFVFCRWNIGDKYCDIRGWCDRSQLRKSEHGKSKRGKWFNLEVSDCELHAFADLVKLVRMEASNGQ